MGRECVGCSQKANVFLGEFSQYLNVYKECIKFGGMRGEGRSFLLKSCRFVKFTN